MFLQQFAQELPQPSVQLLHPQDPFDTIQYQGMNTNKPSFCHLILCSQPLRDPLRRQSLSWLLPSSPDPPLVVSEAFSSMHFEILPA